jgi:NADPH-dependent glutamate synthase beta subunit-like oxidoreductase
MNCQGYIRLIARRKEAEALAEIQEFTPFLGILGRVCTHPCESACERSKIDGPVHIRALKRYLSDKFDDACHRLKAPPEESGMKAVVVGSGPAGLMAAFLLRNFGHAVTVYEAKAEPGGLLRYGIPPFRLPAAEVQKAIHCLIEIGVNIRTGQRVGHEVDGDKLHAEFDATVVAIGAGRPAPVGIPGEEIESVIQAMELISAVKEGQRPKLGRSVIVIGGGNTAIDAALVCRKLGSANVRVVCLERPDEMSASPISLDEAKEEGITIQNCWGVQAMVAREKSSVELKLSRCISVFDAKGNFAPDLEPRCGLRLFADTVVLAVGQRLETNDLPTNVSFSRSRTLLADPLTLEAPEKPGLFVCGDCASGPSSVVHALASGKEAAISANRHMHGEGLRWGRGFWNGSNVKEYLALHERAAGGPRGTLPRLPVPARQMFEETERTFSSQQALKEAERCLSCGRAFEMNHTCWYCLPCEIECPEDALEVKIPYLIR